MFPFLHIMTTNGSWIFHELFSTTNLHEFPRIIIQHRGTKTQSFLSFFEKRLPFFIISSTLKMFLYLFTPFWFSLSNRAHTNWYGEMIKNRFASEKKEKHFWMSFGKRCCSRKNAKASAKRTKKNWAHKTHDRGAVKINEQLHALYVSVFYI